MSDTFDQCGETYEHDLRALGEEDGWVMHECLRCGAEIELEEAIEERL